MSTIIVEQRRPAAVPRPFAGRVRWAAAALLVTGAALQVAEFLLERPLDDTTARVVFLKLQVGDRAQAIVRAREAGLGGASPAPRGP